MEQATVAPLKKTPLNARHRASGARMVPFGGWDMPVEYSGIVAEHLAVRERVGLFDVSHMGEIEIAGKDALAAVQRISSNDASKLQVGQAQYSGLMTDRGTFVDDLLVYRLAPEHFLLVVNAGNIEKDYAYIADADSAGGRRGRRRCEFQIRAARHSGPPGARNPAAADGRQPRRHQVLLVCARGSRRTFAPRFRERVTPARTVSRCSSRRNPPIASGRPFWKPEGRSTSFRAGWAPATRFASKRACACTATTSTTRQRPSKPISNWIVGWKKADFLGAAVLRQQKADGPARKIVGFEMADRGIARHGYNAFVSGATAPAGVVTSGTQTPFLKKAIGMAYLPIAHTAPGHRIRDRHPRPPNPRDRGPMPFYKRAK